MDFDLSKKALSPPLDVYGEEVIGKSFAVIYPQQLATSYRWAMNNHDPTTGEKYIIPDEWINESVTDAEVTDRLAPFVIEHEVLHALGAGHTPQFKWYVMSPHVELMWLKNTPFADASTMISVHKFLGIK